MTRYLDEESALCFRDDRRFIPDGARSENAGRRPSFQMLLDRAGTDSPEWPIIAALLNEMRTAGVELTEPVIDAARKMGAQRWADRLRGSTSETEGTAFMPTLASTSDSVVYYIRRGDLIKIGTTTGPNGRFGDLLPDQIYAVEPGGQPEEHQRHMQFHHLRLFREWFRMAEELMAHIEMIRKLHGDPDPAWPTWATVTSARFTPECERKSAEVITAVEAERRYGIKQNTISTLVRRGQLRRVGKQGGAYLYFADELRARCA
jgi:hypothetical protein